MNRSSSRVRLQDLTFEEMLDSVRQMLADFGPDTLCERTETDWSLDPDDEDDRNASYVFRRTAANSLSRTQRDILLDAFLAWAPVPGDPGIPDVDKLYVLKQVNAVKRQLAKDNQPSTDRAAFSKLAVQNRSLENSAANPLGGIKNKTIERRYYSARKEIRRRLSSERFQRNYSREQLEELSQLLSYQTEDASTAC